MNVRWYLALFDDASDTLHEWMGLTPQYHAAHHTGTMDLEHHIHYLSEVMPGDLVPVYVRFVGNSSKRLHYLMFLVDDTRGKLAATLECINAFADLDKRKTAPFPAEAAAPARACRRPCGRPPCLHGPPAARRRACGLVRWPGRSPDPAPPPPGTSAPTELRHRAPPTRKASYRP